MAKRLLRDWTTSERMDSVSLEAEVFFTRLIMKADDYGTYYANPKLLKAALFPLKEVTYKQIGAWVFECIEAELIFLYEVEGKEYIRINNFEQRLRNKRNIFPHPADNSRQVADNSLTTRGESALEVEVEEKKEVEPEDEVEHADAAAVVDTIKKNVSRGLIPFKEDTPVWNAWLEWEQYRKEKKQTLTPSTVKKQIQFLAGRGDPEIIQIINQSITNGWTGLFEIKNSKHNGRTTVKRSSDAVIQSGRAFGSFE